MSSSREHGLEALTLQFLNRTTFGSNRQEQARLFRAVTGVALPLLDIRMIELLNGRPPTSTVAIAAALIIDLPQTSRRVGKLERQGFLHRTADPDDGRRTLSSLTGTGRAIADRWLTAWAMPLVDTVSIWHPDSCRELNEWLTQVNTVLEAGHPDMPRPMAPQRWTAITTPAIVAGERRELIATTIALLQYAIQSRGFEQLLDELAVPLSQVIYSTLHEIVRHGPTAVRDLAAMTGVDHTQASKRVSRLIELDLVRRASDPFDRRRSLVRSTPRGKDLHTHVTDTQLHQFTVRIGPVDPSDEARWIALMRAFVTAVELTDPAH